MQTIETVGELKKLVDQLPTDTRITALVIDRVRPSMIRRGSVQGEVFFDGTDRVVLAFRPKDVMPVFEHAVDIHGECGSDHGAGI